MEGKSSGRSGTNRKQRTKLESLRVRNRIRELTIEGRTPEEIQKLLDISKPTYWYYTSMIAAEDRKALQHHRQELLAHEILIAKDRLTGSIKRLNEIIDNPETLAKDKLAASQLLNECSISIVRLLVDGPKLLDLPESSETNTATDTFPSDSFVQFAEQAANEQFQRNGEP